MGEIDYLKSRAGYRKARRCQAKDCCAACFPGLVYCYEHASKDAIATLVLEAIRRGYRPSLLRL